MSLFCSRLKNTGISVLFTQLSKLMATLFCTSFIHVFFCLTWKNRCVTTKVSGFLPVFVSDTLWKEYRKGRGEKKNTKKKKTMNTCCKGQYPASICGHWVHAACPLPHIRQGPIVTCNRTNTKKKEIGIVKPRSKPQWVKIMPKQSNIKVLFGWDF